MSVTPTTEPTTAPAMPPRDSDRASTWPVTVDGAMVGKMKGASGVVYIGAAVYEVWERV